MASRPLPRAIPDPQGGDALLTVKLRLASNGNRDAFNELFPLLYEELRALARSRLRAERDEHTLNTTALVHEAYLRLLAQTRVEWQGREHFYAIAARVMRRILVNHAEARRAAKRGGGVAHAELEEFGLAISDAQAEELLALDEALERLRLFNPRGAEVIVQRFFGGLTHEEIAAGMGASTVTVRRAWTAARSWLKRELREHAPNL